MQALPKIVQGGVNNLVRLNTKFVSTAHLRLSLSLSLFLSHSLFLAISFYLSLYLSFSLLCGVHFESRNEALRKEEFYSPLRVCLIEWERCMMTSEDYCDPCGFRDTTKETKRMLMWTSNLPRSHNKKSKLD
jgi:hypothetical protein